MKFIMRAFGAFFLLITLTMCIGAMSGGKTKTTPSAVTVDYEHDLTERCKDWIYNRNRAYKLGREGDVKGSEQARRAMFKFDSDLKKYFTTEQISQEIECLEKNGYRAGF